MVTLRELKKIIFGSSERGRDKDSYVEKEHAEARKDWENKKKDWQKRLKEDTDDWISGKTRGTVDEFVLKDLEGNYSVGNYEEIRKTLEEIKERGVLAEGATYKAERTREEHYPVEVRTDIGTAKETHYRVHLRDGFVKGAENLVSMARKAYSEGHDSIGEEVYETLSDTITQIRENVRTEKGYMPEKEKEKLKKISNELRDLKSGKGDLEKAVSGIIGIGGILISLLFLSPNLTGAAIGSLSKTFSSQIGVISLLIGLISSLFYLYLK